LKKEERSKIWWKAHPYESRRSSFTLPRKRERGSPGRGEKGSSRGIECGHIQEGKVFCVSRRSDSLIGGKKESRSRMRTGEGGTRSGQVDREKTASLLKIGWDGAYYREEWAEAQKVQKTFFVKGGKKPGKKKPMARKGGEKNC